ncbi:MAG: flagellar filament capping protein FliD [Nitrospinaceae bacterium]
MAELTSVFGVNSGFDTAKVVDQLILLQSRPIEINLAKRDAEVEKLNALQDLKSRLQTFKTTLNTFNTESRFIATQGTFTQTGTTTTDIAQITTTSTATSGTFTLEVTTLAREAKTASPGFAAISSTVSQGFLELVVGGKTTLIKIDSTNDTVDGVRLAINNSGVAATANFVDDGDATNPIRLVISGNKTGVANAVSARIFTAGIGVGEITTLAFTQTQAAQDAALKLDGIAITKSSNVISDVISGAILTLSGTGTGDVKISTDLTEIRQKVTDFVSGFNDLNSFVSDQASFDPDTLETGVLFGNFAVQNLQNQLRSTATGKVQGTTGQFNFLSQVGITTQSDGTLVLETSKLNDALNLDVGNVAELFSSKGAVTNSNVTFIGFTQETEPGTYDIRVSGGQAQIRKQGETTFLNAVGSGNFFSGPVGHSSEGLNFRLSSLVDANYGAITVSIGTGEQINRLITNLTDTTLNGPLASEIWTKPCLNWMDGWRSSNGTSRSGSPTSKSFWAD